MDYLSQLRAGRAIELAGGKFAAQKRASARGFVQVTNPISKRSSKSAGTKTRTLKVRNWQITAKHFN